MEITAIAGIDYGAKMAGTTVLARWDFENQEIRLWQSEKKASADDFLLQTLKDHPAEIIAFDAPLSLPGYYSGLEGYNDYFYRDSDRQLGAMSPMFLGGLTARAIKLRDQLEVQAMKVFETYPAATAKRLALQDLDYKKKKADVQPIAQVLQAQLPVPIPLEELSNWHQIDALLALLTAWRIKQKEDVFFGELSEGGIYL